MKIEQIHYLIEINRLHSISAAARALHISQTTLSAIVKVIEDEIGFPIFQRIKQGVIATPAGEQFLARAWEIHVHYEQLLAIKEQTTCVAPTITVLMSPAISLHLAIPLSERFSQFGLQGNLQIEELPNSSISELILNNTANLGLACLTEEEIYYIRQDINQDDLKIEYLLEDELCVIVAEGHPFAQRECLDVKELLDQRVTNLSLRRRDKIMGSATSRGTRRTVFAGFDDMCEAVLKQGLAGFAPRYIGAQAIMKNMPGIRLVPIRNTERENRMYICLLTYKNRSLRYQENILLSCIREYFQKMREVQMETSAAGTEEDVT